MTTLPSKIVQGGLAALKEIGALSKLKTYIDNLNRGSKLTTSNIKVTPEDMKYLNYPADQLSNTGKFSFNVGSVPITKMGSVIEPGALVKQEPFDFDRFTRNKDKAILLEGDQADLGRLLAVNSQELTTPVQLEAGYKYALDPENYLNNRAWASDIGKLSAIRNKAIKASEDGKRKVYGVYSNMAAESGNYANMVSNTALSMLDTTKIKKKDISEFNKLMKERTNKDFPGVEDVDGTREFLNADGAGKYRIIFNKTMESSKFQKAGFPDIASARAATNVDSMFGKGTGDATGRMIAELDLEKPISNVSNHSTYKYSLPRKEGTPIYRAANERGVFVDIPRSMLFDDFVKARREADLPIGSDNRSMSMQLGTQSGASDELLRYLSAQRRGYPFNN